MAKVGSQLNVSQPLPHLAAPLKTQILAGG
jgi:hypothetical protein